jgi:hypothetical protein
MGRNIISTAILPAILLLFICPVLGAQQADRPARVFVSVAPGQGADAAYGSVLADALAVSLTRNHMRPTAFATAGDAQAAAAKGEADYLVFGTWLNTTETLELTVEALMPDGTTLLATGKASGKIGLAFDDVVGEALAGVLPAMQARFPEDGPTIGTGTTTGTVATGAAGTTSTTVTAVGPSGGATSVVEPPSRWRRVELAIGGSPLVSTGELADYVKLGACSALDLDVRFRAGRGLLAAGLQAGAGWFRASGVGVADILVIPAGPDVHWTLSADANPAVSLHVTAGPAVLIAFIGGAGTLAKVSPFVSSGLGVDIGFAPALGLRLEADYLVVFEGSMVLQAFTPRLSLRMRF